MCPFYVCVIHVSYNRDGDNREGEKREMIGEGDRKRGKKEENVHPRPMSMQMERVVSVVQVVLPARKRSIPMSTRVSVAFRL